MKVIATEVGTDFVEYVFRVLKDEDLYLPHRAHLIEVADEEWLEFKEAQRTINDLHDKWSEYESIPFPE